MARIRTKIHETTQRMATVIKVQTFGEKKCNYLFWIITRYLHYAELALLNGYRMNIWRKCKIYLGWTEPRFLTFTEKSNYMFSSLIFDHMFCLTIEGKQIDNERFDFFIDEKLKKKVEEKLSTDAVYQFIKK